MSDIVKDVNNILNVVLKTIIEKAEALCTEMERDIDMIKISFPRNANKIKSILKEVQILNSQNSQIHGQKGYSLSDLSSIFNSDLMNENGNQTAIKSETLQVRESKDKPTFHGNGEFSVNDFESLLENTNETFMSQATQRELSTLDIKETPTCLECKKSFFSQQVLKRHIKSTHDKT